MEWLPIYDDIQAAVSAEHRFGTDAILLSHFAAPTKGERVCELGTGCGVIALRLAATRRPAAVHGVDIQPAAIELARAGADAFPYEPKPTFAVGDWRNYREIASAGSFRRVVCNPPYFPTDSGEISRNEAAQIARHEQADTLDSLCEAVSWLVQSGGSVCLCHRPERLAAVLGALTRHKLEPKRLQAVQKQADTPPWLFLIEARRDGKAGLAWLPPLVLYDPDGQPSAAMKEIYREIR